MGSIPPSIDRETVISLLASTGSVRSSVVLLVLVLIVLTALHEIADAAPPSRLTSLAQGVEIAFPPLIVAFLVAVSLSLADAIR